MDQERPEFAEAIQTGRRRSSLGALSKSKPVTKLKSMFEAKGPAPKIKESGLLGKLKPLYASHDASSFAAALSGSISGAASLKMSVNGPLQQPPATPMAPLFSVLPAPAEPDALPNPSPPRSVEDLQMSVPVYTESLPDAGEVDARSVKSPGSAGFLKRMSSSLKKALTPKSSTGKQKSDGFSPSYAGSEASNLSPRPSGQLLMTPGSQPSSTSLDLNCRSDQMQSAPGRSPPVLMGYEVHSARDYPDWARTCEGGIDVVPRPTSSCTRPPRSPCVQPLPNVPVPDGTAAQHEASPVSMSRDVSPRPTPSASPDQSQVCQNVLATGPPVTAEDNIVSTDDKAASATTMSNNVAAEDSFAASLTTSPTAPDCAEVSHGSPPMREANMGAAIFSPHPMPSAPDPAKLVATNMQSDELVFPSLTSTDLQESTVHAVEAPVRPAGAPQVADGFGILADGSADIDMDASDPTIPGDETPAMASDSDKMLTAVSACVPAASMDVDCVAPQEPVSNQPMQLASRRSFGAAASFNLDLSVAVTNSPDSPDTATPTGEGNIIADSCIIGLTPVRPDTAAMCGMHVDTPTLSTVAESSPEASPLLVSELPVMALEDNFRQEMDMEPESDGMAEAPHEVSVEPALCDAAQPSCGENVRTVPEETHVSESPAATAPSPVHETPSMEVNIVPAPMAADTDMDWDDSATNGPSVECAGMDASEQPSSVTVTSGAPAAAPSAGAAPLCITCEGPSEADDSAPATALHVNVDSAELSVSADAAFSHDQAVSTPQQLIELTGQLEEVAGEEPTPLSTVDGYGILTIPSDGVTEHGEEVAQPNCCHNISEHDGEQTQNSVHSALECCDGDVEAPVGITCSEVADCMVPAVPALEALLPSEVVLEQVEDSAPTEPAAITGEEGELVTGAAETALPSPGAYLPLAELEADAPSVQVATNQQLVATEPCSPDLEEMDEDVAMEDVEDLPTDAPNAGVQRPVRCATQIDMAQLQGSPLAETQTAAAKLGTANCQLQNEMQSAAAGSASSPHGISPDGSAEVVFTHGAAELAPDEPNNASCAAAHEAVPDPIQNVAEQLDLPGTDAVEQPPQQQGAAADIATTSVDAGSNFSEGTMEILNSQQGNNVSALVPAIIPATGVIPEAEGTGPMTDEQLQIESDQVAPPQLAFAEIAVAADALPGVPAEILQQATEADTDLMEVDSLGDAKLPIATASPAHVFAAGSTSVGVPTVVEVDSTSLEEAVGQVLELARTAASETTEALEPSMALHDTYVVDPGTRAEPVPSLEGSMSQAVDQGNFGCSSTSIGMADDAIVSSCIQAAGSPAVTVASIAQVFEAQADTADFPTEQPYMEQDDPMMVSPMPLRISMLLPGSEQVNPRVSPDTDPSTAQNTSSPGIPASISSGTARLGVRAFLLDGVEEPKVSTEARAGVDEVPLQQHLPSEVDHGLAGTLDPLALPLQGISPAIDGTVITSITPATTADDIMDGNVAPTTTSDVAATDGMHEGMSASDVIASVPSVSAPPALSAGVDVAMADSLETIEALWGNDDLLAEPDSAKASSLTPQVASSPVSASKHSAQKVAPGVLLQVQRESLDLFSLRNSCTSRVSDSLMVESLDSFEGMGLAAKTRAVGFVPMATLKEGDEDTAVVGRTSGGGIEGASAPTSAGPPSPDVTFVVRGTGSPDSQTTPGFSAAGKTTACSTGGRSGAQGLAAAAGLSKAPASAIKTATPGAATRANTTPSTALKAMAAANAAGPSASKVCVSKRPLPVTAPQPRPLSTPGQQITGPSAPSSGSRLPGVGATSGAGPSRAAAPTPGAKLPMPSAATPGAASGRPGITPRSTGVFSLGKGQLQSSAISRPGPFAQQPVPSGRAGSGLFDTPLILRAAAVPLADTPLSGCDFDLDTVDISAEASKAIAMLGGGDSSTAAADTAVQHATPVLATVRGAGIAGTPTMSVLETHVQLLTNKLAEAEASIHQLQDENVMLRDQVSTLQFESSMTNDLDMEREARQFLEQELSVVRHRSDVLEADLRASHTELKRRELAAAEMLAAQQTKEAEWARKEAEMELRMQQMTSEVEAARSFAQQADARINEAEARATTATNKCDEEAARSRELQVTLGLQAHQLVQVQRARDDAEAKFQRAMEQLIAAQTSHKKAVVEYEQKLLQSNNLVSQINDVRDKYRQMKQHAANAEQRAQHAEAKMQETVAALAKANMEKAELMQMCNELLTQMEATKVKGAR